MIEKGKLIVIEGVDGCGKKTQTALLKAYLETKDITCVSYEFPRYNTPTGKLIREMLSGKKTSLFEKIDMYANDRLAAREEIVDDLNSGKWVLCDRYVTSMVAYAAAEAVLWADRTPNISDSISDYIVKYVAIKEMIVNKMPVADILILLRLPLELSLSLMQKRSTSSVSSRDVVDLDINEKNILLQEESLKTYDQLMDSKFSTPLGIFKHSCKVDCSELEIPSFESKKGVLSPEVISRKIIDKLENCYFIQ